MNFGNTIKKLRKQKDMTQEQLAEYLNLSTQAISRWETNSSLPDITLLPVIANIFDVSSDTLLGIDITSNDKKIDEIISHADEYGANGYKDKSAEILRAGLKEFPNSYIIMARLMSSIWGISNRDGTDEFWGEVITIGEKILAECTDNDCRHTAIQLLCYTYPKVGEAEKAEKLANEMPPPELSARNLLRSIYSGDKKFRHVQDCIQGNLTDLIMYMRINDRLPDESIIVNNKIIAILEIMFEDGNYGYYTQWIGWQHIENAVSYAKLGDFDNAIESLKVAAAFSVKQDTEFDADKEYSALLFRGKKYGGVYHNITSNDSMNQLEEMNRSAFDPIRDNATFIEIREYLSQYAKKR